VDDRGAEFCAELVGVLMVWLMFKFCCVCKGNGVKVANSDLKQRMLDDDLEMQQPQLL